MAHLYVVDLLIKDGDFLQLFVCLPEGKHSQRRIKTIFFCAAQGGIPMIDQLQKDSWCCIFKG